MDWIKIKLEEIILSQNDKSKQVKSIEYLSSGTFPIIDQSEIFIAGYFEDKNKVISKNLPYTVFGDHTRHVKFIDFPFVCGADGTQLLKPKFDIDEKYFYFVILNASYLIGNFGYDRHFKHLKEFKSYFSYNKPEQTLIAQILTTADKAIAQTEALIAKYQRIKTGLMQDLLTHGVDEHGNIRSEKTHRFKIEKGQKVPVEWEVLDFGNEEYFTLATGGTPSTGRIEYWEDGIIPWMSSGEVHKKEIHSTDNFITELGLRNSNARFYPIGSIVMALAGQGKTRGTVAITKIELTSNQSIAAIIPNQERVNSEFVFYYLSNSYETLRSISAGAGRAGLNLSILSKFVLPIPGLKEQKAISKVLRKTDKRINDEITKKEKLQSIKTGLMQDLLSGKVRVKVEQDNVDK